MLKVQTKSKETKMIYAQQSVARMIAGKMTISKQVQHVVHKVATGFQVVPVIVMQSAMPPAKPLPVMKPQPAAMAALIPEMAGSVMKVTVPTTWTGTAFVVLKFKFRGESKAYVDVWSDDGKPMSFGKATLINWEKLDDRVLVKMPQTAAKKRGVMQYALL